MKTDPTYPVDLITGYFAGEATSDDLVFLAAWLKADPKHREYFESCQKTWARLEKAKIESQADLDREWNELRKKTNVSSTPQPWHELQSVEVESKGFSSYRNLRIAALLLLFLVPVTLLYIYLTRSSTRTLTAEAGLYEGTLPDGTSVTLNKGAVIEFPSRFGAGQRNVKLTGEAFFEVTHDRSKPFIISSENVRVEVLGTSFYVNTRLADGRTEVILSTGKVAIYPGDQASEKVLLAPGERAYISNDGHKIITGVNDDPNFLSWKTHRIIFDNDPLAEVVDMLNKVYRSRIRIADPVLSGCRLTATFDNQSLESVLNVLGATLNITIRQNGAWTDLYGNGCN